MNEVLKREIDRLIEQAQTPLLASPVTAEQYAINAAARTTRVLAFQHLMGVFSIGLALDGMTNAELVETTIRANMVPTKSTPPRNK